jgi:DNA-binding phage protein
LHAAPTESALGATAGRAGLKARLRFTMARSDCIVYVTSMNRAKTGFDKYVQGRMKTPDFASAYTDARAEIDEIDRLMRQIDDARGCASLSKADLARRASTPPESVRRLLTAKKSNPTLQTVVRLASAVGLRVELRPVRAPSRRRRAAVHG